MFFIVSLSFINKLHQPPNLNQKNFLVFSPLIEMTAIYFDVQGIIFIFGEKKDEKRYQRKCPRRERFMV